MKPSWPQRIAIACVLLMALLYAMRQNTDPDLGFHLNAGKYIWEHRSLPPNDAFTYTAGGKAYLDPHGLYQAVLYGAYRLGGYRALTLLKAGLILLLFVILAARLRLALTPPFPSVLLLMAGILTMEMRFEMRPEVFSWVFLSLILLLLDWHKAGRSFVLRLLPLVTLLWAGTQALFILGLSVLVFELIGGRFKDGRWDAPLAKWTGLSFAAVFLNPNGLRGVIFPIQQWDSLTGRVFRENIGEFAKPWSLLLHPNPTTPFGLQGIYYPLALAALILLAMTWRRRNAGDFLLAGTFFALSTTAVRNIPLFIIVILPLAGASLKDICLSRWETWEPPLNKWLIPSAILALLLGLRVVTNAAYASDRRVTKFGWGISREVYPERTARFMLEHGLECLKSVNDIPTGNWLGWRCGMKGMADGRLEAMPEDVFQDILRLPGPGGFRAAVDKYGARLVAVDTQSAYVPVNQLKWLPGWREVFLEGSCVVLAPAEIAKDLPPLDWDAMLAERGIAKPAPHDAERLLSEPPVGKLKDWMEGFYMKKDFPYGLWNLAGAAIQNRRLDAAEAFYLEILRRTRGVFPEVYGQLMGVYRLTSNKGLESLCAQRLSEAGFSRN